MRVHKYRVFNTVDKVMIDKPNSPRMIDGVLTFDPDDIGMEWTGLQDKNGVDIYEGDIVDDQFNCGQLHVIVWNDKTGGFDSKNVKFDAMMKRYWQCSLSISTETTTKGAVIGNVHSNPELLEAKP